MSRTHALEAESLAIDQAALIQELTQHYMLNSDRAHFLANSVINSANQNTVDELIDQLECLVQRSKVSLFFQPKIAAHVLPDEYYSSTRCASSAPACRLTLIILAAAGSMR
jgi:hypothetical protein